MAARTGASVGVAVTITILGVLSLVLFVLAMVFYGNMSKAQNELRQTQESVNEFVRQGERTEERVRRALDRARAERQSVVDYLLTSMRETMTLAGGPDSADMTSAQLADRFAELGGEGGSLIGLVNDLQSHIADLETRLAQSESDRDEALARAHAEATRIGELEATFVAQGDELGDEVGQIRSDFSTLQTGYQDVERQMRDNVDRIASEAGTTISQQRAQINELRTQLAIVNDQIRTLRGEGRVNVVRPLAEEALADATVQRVDPVAREITISIGRAKKAILGMMFAVYDNSSEIRPDPVSGEYARGKATVEIIRIFEGYSVARIIDESRGNPIVKGNVVANAVYDPDKTYKMIVFGNFDIDRDGVATPLEREDLKALIERWGGVVQDEVTGDIDYIILGEKPVVGPEPHAGADVEIVEEHLRRKRVVEEYEALRATAQSTSTPILNENRLRTLIGDYPR